VNFEAEDFLQCGGGLSQRLSTAVAARANALHGDRCDEYDRGLLNGSKIGDATAVNARRENDGLIKLLNARIDSFQLNYSRMRKVAELVDRQNRHRGYPTAAEWADLVAAAKVALDARDPDDR
jgi:hypothetical protein